MRRHEFITLLSGAAWPLAASAQEAGRTYRLGGVSSLPRNAPPFVAMVDELRRLGFIDGQNLTIEWHTGPRIDLIPELAAELVNRAAQHATATIPILGVTEDMVGSGLVNSLARPGGNTTGVSFLATELNGKRQEILIEAVPGLRRMAVLADSKATGSPQLQALQDAAYARNVELSIHRIASAEEITSAIDAALRSAMSPIVVHEYGWPAG